MNKSMISKNKSVEKVSGWDRAIADAKTKIRKLRESIAVFESRKAAGEVWPEPSLNHSATRN
jgi:hypothetical protein